MAKGSPIHEMEVLTSELGAVVGKTPQWLRELTRDGKLAQVSRGKYILGDAVQAFIEHEKGGRADDGKPRFVDEKTDLTRVKKETEELKLRKMRGELHDAADVERVMSDMILTAKSNLQSIASQLAPQLEGLNVAALEKRIAAAIDAALQSLTAYSPDVFGAEDYGEE